MKLSKSKLRRLIKEEVFRLVETQVGLGLPHKFSDEDLYYHVMSYISKTQGVSFDYLSKEYNDANMLLRILSNRISKLGVYHPDHYSFDHDSYETTYTPGKTEEQKEQDYETQGKLKLARYALARHIGDYRFTGLSQSRKSHYKK